MLSSQPEHNTSCAKIIRLYISGAIWSPLGVKKDLFPTPYLYFQESKGLNSSEMQHLTMAKGIKVRQ